MPVVFSTDHRLHVPDGEIWVGVRIVGTELPARGEAIAAAVTEAGHPLVEPRAIDDADLETVHTPELVDFLRTAWARWSRSDYPRDPGQDRVVPYAFPLAALTSGRPPRRPASVGALTGMFAMDTMTLIGSGTWEAVRAAAASALTAAELVIEGAPSSYAAVRPPGHHAGTSFYGGACYLNNAALAADRLRKWQSPVAVIDLDAHHGNGTQQIFYETDTVRYGSVHVDPGAGYFPHWLGFADETGTGDGTGANLNLPLAPGVGDRTWMAAVDQLVQFAAEASTLVVSLGVDAWRDDPESPLLVTIDGYYRAGMELGALGLPSVIVQEGGYDLKALGELVVAFLQGFQTTHRGR
jgi:acetoin utilization deacetylase AcuC-like enzyme